jgi:hypothetical protein
MFNPIRSRNRAALALLLSVAVFVPAPVLPPLQPGRESMAAEVEQAHRSAYRAAPSGRRSLVYMALGIFVGLPAVTALVVFIATLTGWVR